MTTVALLTLGGTISSEAAEAGAGGAAAGVVPRHGATRFADEIAGWTRGVTVLPETVLTVPSPSLGIGDVLAVAARIRSLGSAGVDGVVVSQGTDTIEETAFLLDRLLPSGSPAVVVTGAMRDRTAPSPDGASNLVAAIDVAADPATRSLGVVVVFADQVHAARWVSKRSSFRVDAFVSEAAGPIGRVVERRLEVLSTPPQRSPLVLDAAFEVLSPAPVALVGTGLGDDLRLLGGLAGAGYRGVVVDGMGGGHVSRDALDAISAAAATMPVVVCSRTPSGPALTTTYGYPGAEIDLRARGVLSGGALSAVKARLLLSILLADGASAPRIRSAFEA